MARTLIRKRRLQARRGRPSHTAKVSSLGLPRRSIPELIKYVQAGLPFWALEGLASNSGIPAAEIASAMDISPRTLARRKVAGRFVREESERLLRLTRIVEAAVELFEGDVSAAVAWLRWRRPALGNTTYLAYSGTELGARVVEELIGQLDHGVFP
jgi:putative toxin-antitoxin system antitoxin component (TIGR02293 family)